MTDIRRPVLRDPSPAVLARHERKIAERMARAEWRMIERFERVLGIWRCTICGAGTAQARRERCRGACE
jgi:uncharacterized protein YmfQ (DUF2313 family)